MILEYDHNGKGRAGHGASRGCHSLRGRDEVKILMDCLFGTRTGIQNGKKPHAHGVNVGRYFFFDRSQNASASSRHLVYKEGFSNT